MNIHNQFSFIYFIVFIVILLAVNLLILNSKKRLERIFQLEIIFIGFSFYLLGLFYSEISHSKSWIVKLMVFKIFYLTKTF